MKENFKNKEGITLIALVITIIVLLILAIVTIRIVVNQNIINHANNAVTAYNEAQNNEAEQLTWVEGLMKNKGGSSSSANSSNSTVEIGDLSVLTELESESLEFIEDGGGTFANIAGNIDDGSTGNRTDNWIIAFKNNDKIERIVARIDNVQYIMIPDEEVLQAMLSQGGVPEGTEVGINKLYIMGEGIEEPTSNPITADKFENIIHSESYFNRIVAAVNAQLQK